MKRMILAAFAVALFTLPGAAETPVLAAMQANDVVTLDALATSAASADERALAMAGALTLRHRDEAALAVLVPLTKGDADKDIRAAAWLALSNVLGRQNRYADAWQAMAASRALRSTPFTVDQAQTMDMAMSLEEIRPMTVHGKTNGRLPVTRDKAGLMRVDITVNGVTTDAVFDTGAGLSTVTESTAKKLGVRMLARASNVRSASMEALAMRLGVADRVQFGGATLTNVIFIVLPDSALTFGGGAYSVNAIVGEPVMDALHRIELVQENGKEFLLYGPKRGAPAIGNLLLDGGVPLVLSEADGNVPLRLFVDSGGTASMLNSSATRDHPVLAATAVKLAASLTGAGGSTTDADATRLPLLHLTIAGRTFTLSNVSIYSKSEPGQHGVLGQDVLKQGHGWVMDFTTMSFAISD